MIFCLLMIFFIPAVSGENKYADSLPGIVQFALTDLPEKTDILKVTLMKAGSDSKDGRVRQIQNATFVRDSGRILWNPCNDNTCSYSSFPTSDGNNGPGELLLELSLINPGIDTGSCYGDQTCERLKGAISTKSGLIDGVFKTGKLYGISVSSLQPGIGGQFQVRERT
jgi:hypothetical protein